MIIKSNGTYVLDIAGTGELVIRADGEFGGATVVIGYGTNPNDFKPYIDASATQTSAFQVVLTCGFGESVALQVTGATGTTDINIEAREVNG